MAGLCRVGGGVGACGGGVGVPAADLIWEITGRLDSAGWRKAEMKRVGACLFLHQKRRGGKSATKRGAQVIQIIRQADNAFARPKRPSPHTLAIAVRTRSLHKPCTEPVHRHQRAGSVSHTPSPKHIFRSQPRPRWAGDVARVSSLVMCPREYITFR